MEEHSEHKKSILSKIKHFYDKEYKKLLIIPALLLILAIAQISFQTAKTGDFINKGVSLKGGITLTIPTEKNIDIDELGLALSNKFKENDISVRSLERFGKDVGFIVEADFDENKEMDALINEVNKITFLKLTKEDYTIEIMGSSLGKSFFKEVMKAMFIAFLFMGVVVFFYFGEGIKLKILSTSLAIMAALLIFLVRNKVTDIIAYMVGVFLIALYIRYSVASFAVILAALSDIIVTLAIVNILGIKLSTAGIAAFLMLIGYSVDTDMLLSTRVLKRKEGSVFERVISSLKTGMLMSLTTLSAVVIAFLFAESEVIKQIMIILIIGLLVDLINTWLQNVGILRYYLEKRHKS